MSDSVSWDTFYSDVSSLVRSVQDYHPQVIVPVISGGLIPGALIAEALGIKDIRPIGIQRVDETRRIYYPIYGDIKDLEILLVEDTLKTGLGPRMVKEEFEKRGARVKIAALYITPQCQSFVDYYAKVYDPLPDLPWKKNRIRDRVVVIK